MSGFTDIETPAEGLRPSTVQSSADDILQLLQPMENELDDGDEQTPSGQAAPEGAQELEEYLEPPVEQLSGKQPDEEQPEVEDSEQEGIRYTVKVNGEEKEVTLSELKQGFQLKSDYTRKTQELAQREQEIGSYAEQAQQAREQYAQMVQQMEEKISALLPPEPNWAELAERDPIEHTRKRAAWDQLKTQVESVQQERLRLQQERQAQAQHQYQQFLQRQQHELLQRKPELKEAEKRTEFFSSITNYAAHEYGFTPQEIGAIADHRLLLLAEKAMKYDALQKGSKGKVQTPTHVPTLRPGAAQKGEPVAAVNLRKAKQRLGRSGSTRDAASAIEQML